MTTTSIEAEQLVQAFIKVTEQDKIEWVEVNSENKELFKCASQHTDFSQTMPIFYFYGYVDTAENLIFLSYKCVDRKDPNKVTYGLSQHQENKAVKTISESTDAERLYSIIINKGPAGAHKRIFDKFNNLLD